MKKCITGLYIASRSFNYYCNEAKKGRYFDKLFNKSANVD